jgi:hypothetical protein
MNECNNQGKVNIFSHSMFTIWIHIEDLKRNTEFFPRFWSLNHTLFQQALLYLPFAISNALSAQYFDG